MSDEEHHFESKADAGASKTYPQQAGTIRKNGYIVIKNRPCKVPSRCFLFESWNLVIYFLDLSVIILTMNSELSVWFRFFSVYDF